ncbi:MAG: hypothetical protein GX298_09205 [Planctomycetes bacterium]|nr:hypothetical protein [Planctomycetota bacterium]
MGIKIDTRNQALYFDNPVLPPFLKQLKIINLTVGNAAIDAELQRHANDVTINVVKRYGHVDVWIKK